MSGPDISPSYNPRRERLGDILPLASPFNVIIDVSEVCNFKCGYCFRANAAGPAAGYCRQNGLMDWDTFIRAAGLLAEFPEAVKKVSLSNHGEPLCNRRLPDMARALKRSGYRGEVEIHTNASLLDREYALDLAEAGLDRVIVSIQGLDAEQYRQMCGVRVDVEALCEHLQTWRRHQKGGLLYVKSVDEAIPPGQEARFYQKFSGLADRVFIESVVPLWRGRDDRPAGEKSRGLNKFRRSVPYQECCSLTFYTLVVAPEGTVYPCTWPDISFSLGDIRRNTLKECWEGEKRKAFLRTQLREGRRILADCANCYIPQNTIQSEDDTINGYREAILRRLDGLNG